MTYKLDIYVQQINIVRVKYKKNPGILVQRRTQVSIPNVSLFNVFEIIAYCLMQY